MKAGRWGPEWWRGRGAPQEASRRRAWLGGLSLGSTRFWGFRAVLCPGNGPPGDRAPTSKPSRPPAPAGRGPEAGPLRPAPRGGGSVAEHEALDDIGDTCGPSLARPGFRDAWGADPSIPGQVWALSSAPPPFGWRPLTSECEWRGRAPRKRNSETPAARCLEEQRVLGGEFKVHRRLQRAGVLGSPASACGVEGDGLGGHAQGHPWASTDV